jgi:hypothetical protein
MMARIVGAPSVDHIQPREIREKQIPFGRVSVSITTLAAPLSGSSR